MIEDTDFAELLQSPLDGEPRRQRRWPAALAAFVGAVLILGGGALVLFTAAGDEPETAAPTSVSGPDATVTSAVTGTTSGESPSPSSSVPGAPSTTVAVTETDSPLGTIRWSEVALTVPEDRQGEAGIVVFTGEGFAHVLVTYDQDRAVPSRVLRTSPDGVAWTDHPFEMDGWIDGLVAGGGELYALGNDGRRSQMWLWEGTDWEPTLDLPGPPLSGLVDIGGIAGVAVTPGGELVGIHREVWGVDWEVVLPALPENGWWEGGGATVSMMDAAGRPVGRYHTELVVEGETAELVVRDDETGEVVWESDPTVTARPAAELAAQFVEHGRIEGGSRVFRGDLSSTVPLPIPAGMQPWDLVSGGGEALLVVALDPSNGWSGETVILFSPDGIEWEDVTGSFSPEGTVTVTHVAHRDGRFVAVGTATEVTQIAEGVTSRGVVPATWASDDGLTWERIEVAMEAQERWGATLATGAAGWVLSGPTVCEADECSLLLSMSPDGMVWDVVRMPVGGADAEFTAVTGIALDRRTIVITAMQWDREGRPTPRVWAGSLG